MKSRAFLAAILCLACLAALLLRFRAQTSGDLRRESAGNTQGARSVLAAPILTSGTQRDRDTALHSYGKLPLSFETNQGQADPRVKFLSHNSRMTLLLTADEALIEVAGGTPVANHGANLLPRQRPVSQIKNRRGGPNVPASLLRMKLIGANPAPEVRGVEELPGKSNYFIGREPSKWRTNVPNYAKVSYHEVYPGVDLSFYGHEQQLEYDFVISPGTVPGAIQLGFVGAKSINVDHEGNLTLNLGPGREVSFHKPMVYQPAKDGSAEKEFLDGEYVLEAGNRVGFQVNGADPRRSLIIDPVLSFATYLGGSGSDTPVGIAVDPLGNVYVLGNTTSTNFPTTPSAFQTTFPSQQGLQSAFVTKMNASGTALVYSTYLGATSNIDKTSALALAVDSSGEAYVTGTSAPDFPVTPGAYQTTPPNTNTANTFVAKLNAAGSALAYSTFFAGAASALAIDADGNAYITGGQAYGSGFPVTPGAFQSACGNYQSCAFVTKFNPAGSALIYSTLLGGTSPSPPIGLLSSGVGIAVDSSRSAYVFGDTDSPDFPVTAGAFQSTFQGGNGYQSQTPSDTFVTKFNAAGSALVYSTSLGGQDNDNAGSIAVDNMGSAYLTGETQSANFPITPGALATGPAQGIFHGVGFLTKINPTGTALSYSAEPGLPWALGAVGLDSAGDAFVTGSACPPSPLNFAPNFPVKDPLPGGGTAANCEAFVTEVNGSATALIYSTFLGGNTQIGVAIAVDPAGDAYITGYSTGSDLPVTAGAYQTSLKGTQNIYLAEIPAVHLPATVLSPTSLTFAEQVIGTSTSQAVTLTNAGNGAMSIQAITITGDYSQTNTCPLAANSATLAAGATCAITVTFMPRATGTRTGQLTVTDNEFPSVHVMDLTGSSSSGVASVSSTSLTFGSQHVATTSAAQSVALKNTGTTPLNIASIVAAGDFAQTNTCGASVAAGASCSINVTFSPTAIGSRTGTVLISDTDPTGAQVISLSGTGFGPVVSLSSASLAFGNQNVNTTSPAQLVMLSNTGNDALAITSISASGQFAQTNNCGVSVTAGNSCTINVTFAPTTAGNQTQAVTITDNAAASPQVINLTGIGIAPFSLASTSPTTQTATAGQTATYQMSVASNNSFAGTVSLSCGSAPPKANCSVNPTNVTLSSNGNAAFTVSVATTANSLLPPGPGKFPVGPSEPWNWLLCAAVVCALALLARALPTRPRLALAAGFVLVLLVAGCGGGSSTPPANRGTPAGTYSVSVTASAQGATQAMNLTLVVQ